MCEMKCKTWMLLLLMLLVGACSLHRGYHVPAPALIPGTTAAMNTPGFWIGMTEEPDELIMSAQEIAAFNAAIRQETGMIRDIAGYPATREGTELRETLRAALESMRSRRGYDVQGKKVPDGFFDRIEADMNVAAVPDMTAVQFGLVTAYAHQRILPVESGLYRGKTSHAFDRLQNSALDIGTPLAILHRTSDGAWLYADSPLCSGWLRAQDVGVCSREQMIHYISAGPFVVTLGAKTDIFLDERLTRHHACVRMGTRFVCRPEQRTDAVEILVPVRAQDGSCLFRGGFVSGSAVHRGYLHYTARNIITQAFSLLNAPYGWGGMFGEQDCSRFIQVVFATAGIHFPRNSSQQAKVGRLVASFDETTPVPERLRAVSRGLKPGISTLQMKGHIMLYLGLVNGEPYVIHDMWGYGEKSGGRDNLRVVNRVVVSDLNPGQGAGSGSLLERLITLRVVDAD